MLSQRELVLRRLCRELWETFRCGDADPGFLGCDSQESYNLYKSSAMHFVVDHDLETTSAPNGVARTGEVRFMKTLWHAGYALDMVLQAVDDDGNAISDSKIAVVKSKGDIFTLRLFKNSEANVRFSFVLTGTETVITLPEMYISVLDIERPWSRGSTFLKEGGDAVRCLRRTRS